jgi:pectin methylesterase-like acyl-CoA thioesterase
VNGATNVCIDTPLQIGFDSIPTLGSSGQIRVYNTASPGSPVDTIDLSLSSQSKTFGGTSLHYFPVIIEGKTAYVSLHSSLSYGQTYYVTIDSNAFQNVSSWTGITGANPWTLATKSSAPASDATNIMVDAAGSGDFCTVQGAIDFVPSGNTTPRTIQIKNGAYREIVRNSSRNNLTFLGQDRNQTVMVYANNENMNTGSASRSMFSTSGNDITMKNLKLVNSTPQGGSQAEALKVIGLRFIFSNGELDSLQDTIMVSNSGDQAYFENSLVQGNVDYVWGSGTIYFNNCEIRSVYRGSSPNGYICQPRNDAAHNGIAFVDCQLTGTGGSFNTQYLARNNSKDSTPTSQTVFVSCLMSTNINPVGWYLDGSSSPAGLRFWEYQSTDLNTNLLDVSQRPSWSRQLTADEATDVRTNWFSDWVPQIAP